MTMRSLLKRHSLLDRCISDAPSFAAIARAVSCPHYSRERHYLDSAFELSFEVWGERTVCERERSHLICSVRRLHGLGCRTETQNLLPVLKFLGRQECQDS